MIWNKYTPEVDTSITTQIRKRNYSRKTNKRYKDLETKDLNQSMLVSYKSDGGYQGKGGYIYFFQSNWTLEYAQQYYTNMWRDGLIYIHNSLTLHLKSCSITKTCRQGCPNLWVFNKQCWGGRKHDNLNAFHSTRYSTKYRSNSEFNYSILMIFGFLFFISILYLTYKSIRKIIRKVYETYRYKLVSIEWSDIIDIFLVISSYRTIVYWFIVFLFPPDVKMPVEDEDKF